MSELRLYTFVNFYLSQIQQGIQSAHIVSELMSFQGWPTPNQVDMVKDWAKDHKTIIVCNGGNNEGLGELMSLFRDHRNKFPWTVFHEDEQSLCGALTAVGIVLPEQIFDARYERLDDEWVWEDADSLITYTASTYEYWLLQLIKSKRLA